MTINATEKAERRILIRQIKGFLEILQGLRRVILLDEMFAYVVISLTQFLRVVCFLIEIHHTEDGAVFDWLVYVVGGFYGEQLVVVAVVGIAAAGVFPDFVIASPKNLRQRV